MNNKAAVFFVFMLFSSARFLYAADTLVQQDEAYFRLDELKKAYAEISGKDAEIGRVILEKAGIKEELDKVSSENKTLLDRLSSLHRGILERERNEPQRLEQLSAPLRARIDELSQQLQMQKLVIDQKNLRIDELTAAHKSSLKELEQVSGEKLVIRTELQKLSDQLDGARTLFENKSTDERAGFEAKIKDLQSRLSAEQTLTKEKIRQAEKPLLDKLAALEPCPAQLKVKEAQLAVLSTEKSEQSVRALSFESKNAELLAQINELKQSLEALKRNAKGLPLKP
ncbi:MAG: hypothetical protein HQL20_04255 [Candidatus Omnitrophica bacterium]|nr:hypothetical protein [Candidatus Omnitrophota bacterium]